METVHIQPTVDFKHSPLPDPGLYIRLVEIENCDTADGVIKCNLTTWLSSEAPAYQAISYTWGDPYFNTHIIINGDKLRVRVNCDYALRQARWHGGSQYFWIDSICINQTDVPERNQQVARMDRVFRNSVNVLACLGPHSDNSDILMTFLGKHAGFLIDANDRLAANHATGNTTETRTCYTNESGSPHPRPHSPAEGTKTQRGNKEAAMLASEFMDDVQWRSFGWWRTTKRKRLHLVKSDMDGIWREAPRSAFQRVLPRAAKGQLSQDTEHFFYERVETKPRKKVNIRYNLALCRWRLTLSFGEWCAVCMAYVSFLGRSYFSRVWVMQEVLLAPRMSLCCGQHHQSMASLRGLSKVIEESAERVGHLFMITGEEPFSKAPVSKTLCFVCLHLIRMPLLRRLVPPLSLFPIMFALSEGSDGLSRQFEGMISLSSRRVDERKLMGFDQSLDVMRHLDCEDDRDRIYGALGCVDWDVFTPIKPDYNKTTYQLAIEVLQSLLGYMLISEEGGTLTQYLEAPDAPLTRVAADVAHLLRISRLNEEIIMERQLRQTSKTTIASDSNKETSETTALCGDKEWFGYRICHDGLLDLTGHGKHNSCFLREGRQCRTEDETKFEGVSDFKLLKSTNGIIIGLLPAATRHGDWILHQWMGRPSQPHSEILSQNIGLIVRAPEHGDRWLIVGQALMDNPWQCSGKIQEMNMFTVFFSAKDLLLLCMDSERASGWRELSVVEMRERLETGVCYPDGSSYVHRTFSS